MLKLKEFKVNREYWSRYITVDRLTFKYRDGKTKEYYVIPSKGGVQAIVYNKDKDKYLMIHQFRIPVFYNNVDNEKDISVGDMIEFCAGRLEPGDDDIYERIREEILEELGYSIKKSQIFFLEKLYTCVSVSGAPVYLFYVTVSDFDKVTDGGGDENESLKVVEYTKDELISLAESNTDKMCPLTKMMILKYIKG